MAFTQQYIDHVNQPVFQGAQVYISWVSTRAGLAWQAYVNGVLSWASVESGTNIGIWLPVPASGVERVDIGSVAPAEIDTDFSASLPAPPRRRVKLTWTGGVFEGSDLVGFHVYQSGSANGPVDYSKPVGTVAAYPAGIVIDGYGNGGYGLFGYGNSGGTYTWTSAALTSGTWNFAVAPYDQAGNLGTAMLTSEFVGVPPLEPPRFGDGTRLHYQMDGFGTSPGYGLGGYGLSAPGQPQITLTWNPSPG